MNTLGYTSDFENFLMVCSFNYFFHILQQILVPESQSSPVEEELMSLKEKPNPQKEFPKPPKYIKNSKQGDRKSTQLEVNMVSNSHLWNNIDHIIGIYNYRKKHLEFMC